MYEPIKFENVLGRGHVDAAGDPPAEDPVDDALVRSPDPRPVIIGTSEFCFFRST